MSYESVVSAIAAQMAASNANAPALSAGGIVTDATGVVTDEMMMARQAHEYLMGKAADCAGRLQAQIQQARDTVRALDYQATWGAVTGDAVLAWGDDWAAPAAPVADAVGTPTDSPPETLIGAVLEGEPIIGTAIVSGIYADAADAITATHADGLTSAPAAMGMLAELSAEALATRTSRLTTKARQAQQRVALAQRLELARRWREDIWPAVDAATKVWLGQWEGIRTTAEARLAEMQRAAIPADTQIRSESGRLAADAMEIGRMVETARLAQTKSVSVARVTLSHQQFLAAMQQELTRTLLSVLGTELASYLSSGQIVLHTGASAGLSASASANDSESVTKAQADRRNLAKTYRYEEVNRDGSVTHTVTNASSESNENGSSTTTRGQTSN